MTVTIDGTNGITSPGGDVASASLQTPVLQSASTLTFKTNGTTTAMTVDASQNVGIGTATALNPSAGRGNLTINGSSDAIINFGIGGSLAGYIQQETGGTTYYSSGSSLQRWFTNGTERMRIDSNGRVTINNAGAIDVSRLGIQMATGDNAITIRSYDSSTNVMMMQFYTSAGSRIGFIQTISGTSTTYSTSSDYRLKENIVPMTGALAKVAQLKPVTYKWKSNGLNGQGFIAHELAEVVPDCVTGEKDAVDANGNPVYQGIDTSFLVATLTAAIQELNAKVEALEAKLA